MKHRGWIFIGISTVAIGLSFQTSATHWHHTSSLPFTLSHPSTAVLPNGNVLVVGGSHSLEEEVAAECEVFHPKTEKWTSTSSLPAQVTLSDKKGIAFLPGQSLVVVAGTHCSLYSAETGRWKDRTLTPLADPSSLAQLPASQLFVHTFQGPIAPDGFLAAELINLKDLSSYPILPGESIADEHAFLLPDKRVLFLSQRSTFIAYTGRSDPYDPSANSTSSVANPTGFDIVDGILLPNGKVFVSLSQGPYSHGAEALFDPATLTWTLLTDPFAALGQSLTVLPSGKLLILGGCNTRQGNWWVQFWGNDVRPYLGMNANDCEETDFSAGRLFDPTTNTFRPTDSMIEPRYAHSVVVLPDDRVLVIGGIGNRNFRSTCEIIDLHQLDPE